MFGAIKSMFKGDTPEAANQVPTTPEAAPEALSPRPSGVLNLKKNETLCLRKKEDTSVRDIKLACGWKAGIFNSMDVDIAAITEGGMMSYFGDHEGIPGIKTSADQRNGGEESITVKLDKIPQGVNKVYFVMNIYDAHDREQNLGSLKQAWASVYLNGSQAAKFDIPDFNKKDTGIILGALERTDGTWDFRTIGTSQDVSSLRDFRF